MQCFKEGVVSERRCEIDGSWQWGSLYSMLSMPPCILNGTNIEELWIGYVLN